MASSRQYQVSHPLHPLVQAVYLSPVCLAQRSIYQTMMSATWYTVETSSTMCQLLLSDWLLLMTSSSHYQIKLLPSTQLHIIGATMDGATLLLPGEHIGSQWNCEATSIHSLWWIQWWHLKLAGLACQGLVYTWQVLSTPLVHPVAGLCNRHGMGLQDNTEY